MMSPETVKRRALRKARRLLEDRRDPRYLRTLGRLVAEGLMVTNHEVKRHREPLRLEDALWAADIEPRFLELLPALIARRPSMFVDIKNLPEDLRASVRRLRRGQEPEAFRGVSGERLLEWLPRVGRIRKLPARLRSFRLNETDLRILSALSASLGVTETEVIRRGLRALCP